MSKDKFPNLGRGGSRLQGSLTSFKKKGSDNISVNPLKNEKLKTSVKKTVKSQDDKPLGVSKTKIIEKSKTKIKMIEPSLNDVPNDFKPHSALFSSGQLDELRSLVDFKKWKVNHKFTIQQAIYEAIQGLFNKRVPCNDFPDDFITYTPAFSETQWQLLSVDFVPEVRFIQKGHYGLKYAIYEAIKMYIDNNPINS